MTPRIDLLDPERGYVLPGGGLRFEREMTTQNARALGEFFKEDLAVGNVVESWAAAVRRKDYEGILKIIHPIPYGSMFHRRFNPKESKPTKRLGTCFSLAPVIRSFLILPQ